MHTKTRSWMSVTWYWSMCSCYISYSNTQFLWRHLALSVRKHCSRRAWRKQLGDEYQALGSENGRTFVPWKVDRVEWRSHRKNPIAVAYNHPDDTNPWECEIIHTLEQKLLLLPHAVFVIKRGRTRLPANFCRQVRHWYRNITLYLPLC